MVLLCISLIITYPSFPILCGGFMLCYLQFIELPACSTLWQALSTSRPFSLWVGGGPRRWGVLRRRRRIWASISCLVSSHLVPAKTKVHAHTPPMKMMTYCNEPFLVKIFCVSSCMYWASSMNLMIEWSISTKAFDTQVDLGYYNFLNSEIKNYATVIVWRLQMERCIHMKMPENTFTL